MAVAANHENLSVLPELEELFPLAGVGTPILEMPVDHSVGPSLSAITPLPHAANAVRPPESEIYGRSLSTIRRLGAYMINRVSADIISSPEAAQAKVEFYTSVEEGFGTDMELGGGLEVRDFDIRPVLDGHVMAKDLKTAISSMTGAGHICAVETARRDKRFLPQLARSEWDHENALTVDKMARGETDYNTRIVISPFPEEAAAQSGNEYWRDIGYVPHLRRGFVQLYHIAKDGTNLLAGSLSFDGSDKRQLREIFSQFDVDIPAEESTDNWLKYAITDNLSEDEAKATAIAIANRAGKPKRWPSAHSVVETITNTVDVTARYKPIMERAFNESYVHICESLVRGSQTVGARELIYQLADNARHFNDRYAKALYGMRANRQQFTDADSVILHELLVYSTIEMMRALHLNKKEMHSDHTNMTYSDTAYAAVCQLESVEASLFQSTLSNFGADGARNNRTYSACGLSISLGESKPENSPQNAFAGMGEKDKDDMDDVDDLGPRWFTCRKGHMNYRKVPNIPEKKCTSCGVDVSCKKPVAPKKPIAVSPPKTLFGPKKSYENGQPAKLRAFFVGKKALAGSTG